MPWWHLNRWTSRHHSKRINVELPARGCRKFRAVVRRSRAAVFGTTPWPLHCTLCLLVRTRMKGCRASEAWKAMGCLLLTFMPPPFKPHRRPVSSPSFRSRQLAAGYEATRGPTLAAFCSWQVLSDGRSTNDTISRATTVAKLRDTVLSLVRLA